MQGTITDCTAGCWQQDIVCQGASWWCEDPFVHLRGWWGQCRWCIICNGNQYSFAHGCWYRWDVVWEDCEGNHKYPGQHSITNWNCTFMHQLFNITIILWACTEICQNQFQIMVLLLLLMQILPRCWRPQAIHPPEVSHCLFAPRATC